MLRVYAAAYGLNAPQHAVVEVSQDAILLRLDTRVVRFERHSAVLADGRNVPFHLNEDGTAEVDGERHDLDMAAESVARGLFAAE